MDLSLVAEQFCNTPVFYLDAAGEWVEADARGRLAAYDRFISDRAFGQKKRILQTPGDELLPESKYVRVGKENSRTYMVESVNADLDENGEYLNSYMLREAATAVGVMVQTVTPQASGAGKTTWVRSRTIYADFDRYGVLHSGELPVDYSSFTLSILPSEVLPKDCRLEIDGEVLTITERYMQLELLQMKLRGLNGQP